MSRSPTVRLRLCTSPASEMQETRADLHGRRTRLPAPPDAQPTPRNAPATVYFPVLSLEVIFRLNQQSWDLEVQRVQITQCSVSPRDYVLSVGIPGAILQAGRCCQHPLRVSPPQTHCNHVSSTPVSLQLLPHACVNTPNSSLARE